MQFIRGFAVKGGGKNNNDCKIEVKSGAFSWIDLNFKDKRYRKLSPTQEKFLSFCLNQYWKQNTKTMFCFDEFLQQHQTPICPVSKQPFVKTDAIKPEGKRAIRNMVSGYNVQTFLSMESNQF